MKKIKDLTREDLVELITEHGSIKRILIALNYSGTGASFGILKKRISDFGIALPKADFTPIQRTNTELFCMSDSPRTITVKKRIIKEKLIPYQCSVCNNDGFHNDKPLSLQLDHIDGSPLNNQLDNLRFLCPNCHSQTETFGGRKNRLNLPTNYCRCGKKIQKTSLSCHECKDNKSKPKIIWPAPSDLQQLLWEKPTSKIAADLGVSDKAIEKFCKKNGLSKPARGYWN